MLTLCSLQTLVRGDVCGGPPWHRFGARAGVFLFILLVMVVLQHVGLDLLTALGLVMVTSCLTAEVSARVFGLPALARGGA